MKLSNLIDRLIEIHNSKTNYDPEVSIMEEHEVNGEVIQFGSKVKDVASSNRSGVIIIGQELD